MIIGTITLLHMLFFGGGGFDFLGEIAKMNDKVDDVVTDETRAAGIHSVLEAMQSEYGEFARELEAQRVDVRSLDLRYDVSASEYRGVFDAVMETWEKRESRVLELRSELHGKTTREEWDALHKDVREKVEKMDKKAEEKRQKEGWS